MTKEKTIRVSVEVGMQKIADTLFSAETGCNYWADAGELSYAENVMAMLAGERTLTVEDNEDEKLHTISLSKVKKGLRIMAIEAPRTFADLIDDNADETTADALVQYALFGELVYG